MVGSLMGGCKRGEVFGVTEGQREEESVKGEK